MTTEQLHEKLFQLSYEDGLALIQQNKGEWLFEFISWYADEYELKFTDGFKSGLIKRFLNAPEPE